MKNPKEKISNKSIHSKLPLLDGNEKEILPSKLPSKHHTKNFVAVPILSKITKNSFHINEILKEKESPLENVKIKEIDSSQSSNLVSKLSKLHLTGQEDKVKSNYFCRCLPLF